MIRTRFAVLTFAMLAIASTGALAAPQPAVPPPAAQPAAPGPTSGAPAGSITLPSGLAYKVMRSGPARGAHPKAGDAIKVHYEGALPTGAVFDSSYQRGKPAVMILKNLVPGWMEALPLMRPGDAWTLYLPAALGYGDEGAGPIPPGSPLVFKLELLGLLSADEPASPTQSSPPPRAGRSRR